MTALDHTGPRPWTSARPAWLGFFAWLLAGLLFQATAARASYTLSWTNCNYLGGTTGFTIERSDAGASFVQIATVNSSSATTYADATATRPIVYAYRVRAFNAIGVYSNYTNIASNAAASTPSAGEVASQTAATGGTVVLAAPVAGNVATTYQWEFNGAAIPGATGARFELANAAAADAGTYTCVATSASGGSSTSTILSVASTNNIGRLTNLSVLNPASGSEVLTLGFVVGGAGTSGSEPLLIRASGPALATFGIANPLSDPKFSLYKGAAMIGSNDNWAATAANQAAVTAADAADFAFPLTNPSSLDAAMAASMPGNTAYSVAVSGNGSAAGMVIAEVYDGTPAGTYVPTMPRLVNLSCLTQVAASGSLTAGFIIGGATSKTVLIRASGPALAAFGVSGVMPDPQLSLHTSVSGEDTVLAFNAGWAGDPEITAADTAAGAFALTNSNSKDSAVLITLPPGTYTAQVASASGTAGTTMVEVYEVQ